LRLRRGGRITGALRAARLRRRRGIFRLFRARRGRNAGIRATTGQIIDRTGEEEQREQHSKDDPRPAPASFRGRATFKLAQLALLS
jgi:hypothetical protein